MVNGSPDGRFHVYLGGDGSPRSAIRYRPPDPTPKRSLMLELMALDPRPGLFVGRPCYHAVEPCEPEHWTLGRYSPSVVRSLVAALRQLNPEKRPLVLIGHSGGGTLAMLMAPHLRETVAVMTVAGNLDVAAFSQHHGFQTLSGSDNPAEAPPLAEPIFQLHLVGARDRVVPPEITRAAIARQPGAQRQDFQDHDHHEGWAEVWPDILRRIDRELRSRSDRPN